MTSRASRSVFFAVLALAALTRADAPTDQYAPFNAQAATILDNKTHLIWTRIVQPPSTQATASQSCAGGGTRLPTYRELLSIVDEDPHNDWDPDAGMTTPRFIDPNAFPGTPGDVFWTLSPSPGNVTFMTVNFGDGEAHVALVNSVAYSRCVADQ